MGLQPLLAALLSLHVVCMLDAAGAWFSWVRHAVTHWVHDFCVCRCIISIALLSYNSGGTVNDHRRSTQTIFPHHRRTVTDKHVNPRRIWASISADSRDLEHHRPADNSIYLF